MVASCQPPLACKGKNKSIDTIAHINDSRLAAGLREGNCPAPLRLQQARQAGALQPDAGLQSGLWGSAEIIPALTRNIPPPALGLSAVRRPAWGNPCLTPACPLSSRSSARPLPSGRALGRAVPPGSVHIARGRAPSIASQLCAAAAAPAPPPRPCLSTSSAPTNLPYVSANRGNCWNQCLIGFRLWQTACRYIFLCQSRRGRRGARELGDAEWK